MIQIILSLFLSIQLQARQTPMSLEVLKTVRIALIDSGFPTFKTNVKLCNNAVFDTTKTDIFDKIGHSTNLLGILEEGLKDVDYCVYVIKVYDKLPGSYLDHLTAFNLVLMLGDVDIVNYSSSSMGGDNEIEHKILTNMSNHGILFVTAAGNYKHNLDEKCDVYPTCYLDIPNIVSVGNGVSNDEHSKTSDYGKVIKAWHVGDNIKANGIIMSGTSQATALETVEWAKKLYYNKK